MTAASAQNGRTAARRFAPFGQHTRYMLVRYLLHVLLVTGVLLTIALTIDLWPQFETVAKAGGGGPLAAVWNLARFAALRSPWLIAPFLSFATYLGVFWTEVAHTSSGERMLVWNSGRSPFLCLAPVLLLGVLLGAGEFVLDAYLGPAAMGVQMTERFGLDGQRLDRTRTSPAAWIALPQGLLRTEVEYGPPPVLHHLMLFSRNANGRLARVETAAVARLEPGTNRWHLTDGYAWTAHGEDAPVVLGGQDEKLVPFKARTVVLDLDPLWLSMYGIEPQYLRFDTLRSLVRTDRDPESLYKCRTRLNVLLGETVLPGAMALLAAVLSMVFMAYGVAGRALIGIVFTGYVAHFATKACLLLGQTGYIAAPLAGWLVPGCLTAAAALVLAIAQRQRRLTSA